MIVNRRKRTLPKLVHFYRDYLLDELGANFVRSVAAVYNIASLRQLASRGSPVIRRAAVLALGMIGDMDVNDALGEALRDDDRGVRLLADQWIRDIWLRGGSSAQQQKLRVAQRHNQNFQFAQAWQACTDLIAEDSSWAEAYHQRAIASACAGEVDAAADDCRMALELNPYHFAAAAALGQAMIESDEHDMALQYFEWALQLNPSLEGVRARVQQLQRQLGR